MLEDVLQHTHTNDIELEAALQQLLLNLRRDAVEAHVRLGEHGGLLRVLHRCCRHCRRTLRGRWMW